MDPELDFTLVAYNVFLRPRFPMLFDGQRARFEGLCRYLDNPGFDALALAEVFDHDLRDALLQRLGASFPHHSRVAGPSVGCWKAPGGVVVLSRWPIEHEAQRAFGPVARAEDRFANKAVLYARIAKEGRRVHLFATHLNSRLPGAAVRARQLEIIAAFAKEQAIPEDEPVLFAGDFNVDRAERAEYDNMLATLDAVAPEHRGAEYSYDPTTNPLTSGRHGLLIDHVLCSRAHRLPLASHVEVQRPRGTGWRALPWRAPTSELSDHYPVVARLQYSFEACAA